VQHGLLVITGRDNGKFYHGCRLICFQRSVKSEKVTNSAPSASNIFTSWVITLVFTSD
jgi:hypothetical protein